MISMKTDMSAQYSEVYSNGASNAFFDEETLAGLICCVWSILASLSSPFYGHVPQYVMRLQNLCGFSSSILLAQLPVKASWPEYWFDVWFTLCGTWANIAIHPVDAVFCFCFLAYISLPKSSLNVWTLLDSTASIPALTKIRRKY